MSHRRRNGIALVGIAGALVVALAVLAVIGVAGKTVTGAGTTSLIPTIPTTTNPYAAIEARTLRAAEQVVNVSLPSFRGDAAPVLPALAYSVPLGPHQTIGFVPYYELGSISSEDLADFTDLVYSSVEVADNGTLVESDSSGGWAALLNGGAGDLVAAGHASGDRVLLSLFADSQPVLGGLSGHPAIYGRRLAGEVAPLLADHGFDGVDIDLEGQDASDRAGFVSFVAAFSNALWASDSTWAIMLNTYPQSAEDPTGFFDVKALAVHVDQLFVMAYDMDSTEIPSANAPLDGTSLSDANALASYVAAGLGPKVILGIPFYGYDFPASGPADGAAATGSPYAVTYDEIVTSVNHDGHRPLWDTGTATPYIVFRTGKQWHQTWFDDPVSVALKTALAAEFGVAGVGAWELGMVAGAPQMISELGGGSPVVKLPLAHQP
jgi:hypothetical protein